MICANEMRKEEVPVTTFVVDGGIFDRTMVPAPFSDISCRGKTEMELARLLRATGAIDGDFAVNSGDGSDVVSVHRECGIEIGEN